MLILGIYIVRACIKWNVFCSQALTWCCLIFHRSPPLIRDAHTTGLVKYREPYPFGVDPSWRGSRSELPFLNSLKMKMSILFGVVHMNLGIMLSYFNARFFGSSLDIRCLTFLTSPYTYYFASYPLSKMF
jgi:hypothetical protein